MADITKVTWERVGRVTTPGRFPFKFGWLTITAEDLRVWEIHPNAAFTLVKVLNADSWVEEFRLGSFELNGTVPDKS